MVAKRLQLGKYNNIAVFAGIDVFHARGVVDEGINHKCHSGIKNKKRGCQITTPMSK